MELSAYFLNVSGNVWPESVTRFLLTVSSCDPLHGSVLAVCPIEFPMILRDSLEVLSLNDNQLECVPQSVCGLHSLTELYLSK